MCCQGEWGVEGGRKKEEREGINNTQKQCIYPLCPVHGLTFFGSRQSKSLNLIPTSTCKKKKGKKSVSKYSLKNQHGCIRKKNNTRVWSREIRTSCWKIRPNPRVFAIATYHWDTITTTASLFVVPL